MNTNLYAMYKKVNDSIEELKSYIRNEANSLDDRFDLFRQAYHLFPCANYLSECSLTDRQSPSFDERWLDTNYRSYIKVDCILEIYLDKLYNELPDEIYTQYEDNVPLSVLLTQSSYQHKKDIETYILALMQDCISGIVLDW